MASVILEKTFRNFCGIDFVDQEEVGWGFSGLVLKSLHLPSNRILARKIIHETPRKRRELFVTHKEVEFYEKIQRMGRDCENVVKCFGFLPVGTRGHINGGLVFEFMDLGSLSDHLLLQNHRPFPEQIILYIAESLLKACAQLETLDIVHRDIKPSNVLFNSMGGVKLCDFGEACYSWESEGEGGDYCGMAGSTAYMAPERLACLSHSHSSDIWSVGLVLLELTFKRYPFANTPVESDSFGGDCSIIELWEMVMEADSFPQVSPENYSQGLAELVSNCMRKDFRQRPSAQSLLKQFSSVLRGRAGSDEFVSFFCYN